jgi:hypothetical protein
VPKILNWPTPVSSLPKYWRQFKVLLIFSDKIITITTRMVVKLREGAQMPISTMKKIRNSGKETLIEPSSGFSENYFTDFVFEQK